MGRLGLGRTIVDGRTKAAANDAAIVISERGRSMEGGRDGGGIVMEMSLEIGFVGEEEVVATIIKTTR